MRSEEVKPTGRLQGFRVNRGAGEKTHPFREVFEGVEGSPAVRAIFGEEQVAGVLDGVRVEVSAPMPRYMKVSRDGHIVVGERYLREGDERSLYLDLIHELVHLKQQWEGKDLFDPRYSYVDRPTEVEAYRWAVKEARRLGMSDEEVEGYLKTDWMSGEDLKRLAENVGLRRRTSHSKPNPDRL